ncbi:MAG: hypothetical protein RSC10_00450 [Longicatena sp.]
MNILFPITKLFEGLFSLNIIKSYNPGLSDRLLLEFIMYFSKYNVMAYITYIILFTSIVVLLVGVTEIVGLDKKVNTDWVCTYIRLDYLYETFLIGFFVGGFLDSFIGITIHPLYFMMIILGIILVVDHNKKYSEYKGLTDDIILVQIYILAIVYWPIRLLSWDLKSIMDWEGPFAILIYILQICFLCCFQYNFSERRCRIKKNKSRN